MFYFEMVHNISDGNKLVVKDKSSSKIKDDLELWHFLSGGEIVNKKCKCEKPLFSNLNRYTAHSFTLSLMTRWPTDGEFSRFIC